jgi:hypothetical protein
LVWYRKNIDNYNAYNADEKEKAMWTGTAVNKVQFCILSFFQNVYSIPHNTIQNRKQRSLKLLLKFLKVFRFDLEINPVCYIFSHKRLANGYHFFVLTRPIWDLHCKQFDSKAVKGTFFIRILIILPPDPGTGAQTRKKVGTQEAPRAAVNSEMRMGDRSEG